MTWREGCWACFLFIALLFPPAGYGQVGSTTDILTGVIIGMDAPLAGAQVVRDSLRAIIDRAGPRPDQALLSSRLRPYLQQSQQHAREALDLARLALTAEQWMKLPDALKLDRRD